MTSVEVLLTNRQYSPFWLAKGSSCLLHHPAQICHTHKKMDINCMLKFWTYCFSQQIIGVFTAEYKLLCILKCEWTFSNISALGLGVANKCKRIICLHSPWVKCPYVHTCILPAPLSLAEISNHQPLWITALVVVFAVCVLIWSL